MIELKNENGEVVYLIKYDLIGVISIGVDSKNNPCINVYEKELSVGITVCYNTMEDIQAQIRAIKDDREEFGNLPTTDRKIVIDYDVSAKDKNEITRVTVGNYEVPSEFYTIEGRTLILNKHFPTRK